MAHAVVVMKDPLPPPIEKVVLELTENEAKALVMLLGCITGNEKKSLRKHLENIYSVLEKETKFPVDVDEKHISGLVYCLDLEKGDPLNAH